MRTIENYGQYVIIPEKISQANIARARSEFRRIFCNIPLEIRLGSSSVNDMFSEIKIEHIPASFTGETVQGLIIMLDPSLKADEWLVGRSQAIVKERT